jgi:hypothetical protein
MSEINNETDVDVTDVVDISREAFCTVNESAVQEGTITFRKIEYSEWRCLMFASTYFIPLKGDEPNWFWRWTQHLILGHKWIKEKRHD